MSDTSEKLFNYLRDVFYSAADAKLNLDEVDEDYVTLGKGLMYFAQCVSEYHEFAGALAKGDLCAPMPPPENELVAPLKSLHANLKHLTWQSKQVAKGDYKQHVDFMGEFADSFNTMIKQLADRQEKLENEIIMSRKHAKAMEQSNMLLSKLTYYIPEQIFVVSAEKHEVLLTNDSAQVEMDKNPQYIKKLMSMLPKQGSLTGSNYFEVQFTESCMDHYLSINTYQIEWNEENAVALVINDVSVEKRQLKELEKYAYRDSLAHCYNRHFGMLTLNEWLDQKRQFALVFIDLDNLKYVNDKFGHSDGDEYISRVSKHLQSYSKDAIVCRIGGDEFMLLAPESDFDEAHCRMEELQYDIQNDICLHGKDYYYSISHGVVAIDSDNELSASDILSIADDRMYEHKRARKNEWFSVI